MSHPPKPDAHQFVHDPVFLALVKKKNRISAVLTVLMLALYFGFAALLAFSPQTLAAPFGATTIGIPFGIGIILIACILTGIYVRWANSEYDSMIKELKQRLAEKEGETTE